MTESVLLGYCRSFMSYIQSSDAVYTALCTLLFILLVYCTLVNAALELLGPPGRVPRQETCTFCSLLNALSLCPLSNFSCNSILSD